MFPWGKFFFQLVFCGTAATIVSGAVAERVKYISFILFSFVLTLVIYPIVGHWIWGGGWLADLGFLDFAGDTAVHSVGGWAALSGAMILGPRIGKYDKDGKPRAIPGHNMSLAVIGLFVLWLGWFGFNPGSTMSFQNPSDVMHILVTTNTSAIAAVLTSTITSWVYLGKPDLGMTINGCLAGLVGITGSCAYVTIEASLLIGAVAGVFVVFAVVFFDRIKIDDPVGATSVHLGCGVLGTLCVGLFAKEGVTTLSTANGLFYGGGVSLLGVELLGIVAVGVFTFAASSLVWLVLKKIIGIRVSAAEELAGLDVGEHGQRGLSRLCRRGRQCGGLRRCRRERRPSDSRCRSGRLHRRGGSRDPQRAARRSHHQGHHSHQPVPFCTVGGRAGPLGRHRSDGHQRVWLRHSEGAHYLLPRRARRPGCCPRSRSTW